MARKGQKETAGTKDKRRLLNMGVTVRQKPLASRKKGRIGKVKT
jgi:hypothetical protein